MARILHHRPATRGDDGERSPFGDGLGEVAHTRREPFGLRCAEKVAVVLHRGAASRAVDDDRRVAGHRRDHPPGEPPGVVDAARVHVQRTAAVAAGSGPRARQPARREHGGRRAMRVAHPRVHHAAGEQPGVGTPADGELEWPSQLPCAQRRDAETRRQEPQALPEPSQPRQCHQHTVAGQHHPIREPFRCPPQPRHSRSSEAAGGLAASAARVPSMRCPNGTDDGHAASQPRHCTHSSITRCERGVDRRAVQLDGPHRRDPAARRCRFEARHAIRRAVRKTQPARDARDQLVLVEPEHPQPLRDHGRRGGGVTHIGSRPGESLPVGSNAFLSRRAIA